MKHQQKIEKSLELSGDLDTTLKQSFNEVFNEHLTVDHLIQEINTNMSSKVTGRLSLVSTHRKASLLDDIEMLYDFFC